MAQKSHKNNKHIAELIESATVTALQLLAQVDKFAMLGDIDASLPDDQARAALREHILKIKREDITIADQEAVRLLQLVRFRTEEMLEHAYRELEFEQHAEIATFEKSADAMIASSPSALTNRSRSSPSGPSATSWACSRARSTCAPQPPRVRCSWTHGFRRSP